MNFFDKLDEFFDKFFDKFFYDFFYDFFDKFFDHFLTIFWQLPRIWSLELLGNDMDGPKVCNLICMNRQYSAFFSWWSLKCDTFKAWKLLKLISALFIFLYIVILADFTTWICWFKIDENHFIHLEHNLQDPLWQSDIFKISNDGGNDESIH